MPIAALWLLLSFALSSGPLGATLQVPADYPTIQACIDAAVDGDECVVPPGTYNETIDFLGKAITLRSSGGADVTTIDATGIGGSVVTCATGEGPDTVLVGFTITGGTGTVIDPGYAVGGGMFNDGGSPTIINCMFNGNTSDRGAGMYNLSSIPTVTDCTFSGNTGTDRGGGMYNDRSSPTLNACTFSGNIAYVGGGMFNHYSSSPMLKNCTFSGNTASASNGGGMYNYNSSPTVANCTFDENSASNGGAMHNFFFSSPTVSNCIIWGQSQYKIVNLYVSAPTFRFSDVQGGLPVGAVDGGGNIDLDPMFVRPPDPGPDGNWDGVDDDYGDLRLQPGSPCINAGDPAFVPQPGESDLDGHARVLCGWVDMGAYEFGIGDYDCDQAVDLSDFAYWMGCVAPLVCEAFDFDGDGDLDLFDFAGFQNAFNGE